MGHDPTENTRVGPHPERPRLEASQQRSFLRRVGAIYEYLDPDDEACFWLFWGTEGTLSWRRLRDGEHVVAGRHPSCDLPLAGDREISLRHLLVTTSTLADGASSLRLLNLRAPLPFFLDDDTPRWSMATADTLLLRLGTYHLLALPAGTGPGGASNRRFRELPSYHKHQSEAPRPPRPTRHSDDDDESAVSHITLSPPISSLGQVEPPAPDDAFAQLTVSGHGAGAVVHLGERDLRQGVLIGRSDKCHDRQLTRVLSGGVSRAHLLLLHDDDGTRAYDLCSTNGTYVHGDEVRSLLLPDEATLELGRGDGVRVRWRRRFR